MTIRHKDRLFHYVIKIDKDQSAFLYFTLEANEGICFYSTLEHEKGQPHRDIDIKGHIDLQNEMSDLLESLKEKLNFEITHSSIIEDQ